MRKKNEIPFVIDKPLCLYRKANFSETMHTLRRINDASYRFGHSVEIDLSITPYVSAAASLLLFAIVNRAQLCLHEGQTIRITLPTRKGNSEGYRWIVSTGLAKALMASTFEKLDELTTSGRFYQSSVDPYSHHATTAQMLNLRSTSAFSDEQYALLESGISEAMLNVSHHAYDAVQYNELISKLGGKRWWQCAWFDEGKNRVTFIICDLGMGIPRSFHGDSLQPFLQGITLADAWTHGATRTGVSGRGNGSEDIKSPVGVGCTDSETLLILSGHGTYLKSSQDNKVTSDYTEDEIPGTLVQWSLVPKRGQL
ncbi:hypothetical protein [Enterobacter bugandensis]|uniref:hypothetical protein n=1 Tax=Enterobacter bugandensis TaxID=881260 RepID=UPI00300D8EF8